MASIFLQCVVGGGTEAPPTGAPSLLMEPVVVREANLVVNEIACANGRAWQVRRTSALKAGAKEPGDVHRVTFASGVWSCCCKAWQYRGACRHASAVKQLLNGESHG
jgi:hypothetical protein